SGRSLQPRLHAVLLARRPAAVRRPRVSIDAAEDEGAFDDAAAADPCTAAGCAGGTGGGPGADAGEGTERAISISEGIDRFASALCPAHDWGLGGFQGG